MRILIVEDETRVAKYLQKLTRDILGSKLRSLYVCQSLTDGKNFLKTRTIDILLLDLNLNGRDGFDLLKTLVAESFQTVIVSAYREKAIEAFKYGILDFVPKPFTRARLEKALNRVLENDRRAKHPSKVLAVRLNHRIRLVALGDVLYFKGARIYSEVHMCNGEMVLHDKSLSQLSLILPEHFQRIHKSYLVDMNSVKRCGRIPAANTRSFCRTI